MELVDARTSSKIIQSGLFDSHSKGFTPPIPVVASVPTTTPSTPIAKPKAIRKKKEVVVSAPASAPASPETKPKKIKVAAPVPVSAPAPVPVAAVSATPATKSKLVKGSQEAKDYMAEIRSKKSVQAKSVAPAPAAPAAAPVAAPAVAAPAPAKQSRKKKEKLLA